MSANLFSLLGISLPQGQASCREMIDRGDCVVVLSERTWLNRFGGRADIVGHLIRIDGTPHEMSGGTAGLLQ
ncbi:MAG: hypothetical protein U1F61_03390 [Opitutaceae bacterium]